MSGPKELKCSACKNTLPVKAFNKRKNHPRGYQYTCIKCKGRSAHKNSYRKRVQELGQRISNMDVVADNGTAFTKRIGFLVEQQLTLFYPKGGNTISEMRRIGIIRDCTAEIKQALSRASGRMRTLYGTGNATVLPNLRHRVKIDTAYDLLDADPDDTDEQLKAAYRKLAKKHHPDSGGNEEAMKQINRAYELVTEDRNGTEETLSV